MTEPIWRPSAERVAASHLQRFLSLHRQKLETEDYAGLHHWSVSDPEAFWAALWDYFEIRSSAPYTSVVDDIHAMPGATWFDGAAMNYAENLLRPQYDGVALIAYTETGRRIEKSWDQLRREVASVAQALREMGVGPNDRVAALLPNCPEAIVAMLASTSLGAIWSSCSPDFGSDGVLDRFGQIEPKVLFAANGYSYNGKTIDCLPAVRSIAGQLASVDALIIVDFLDDGADIDDLSNAIRYPDIANDNAVLEFEQLPFSHPLYILYSSGTTGIPKCIVHSAGASLIQHQKEHMIHSDVKAGDVIFYFTTCGWMMWNWLASGLASGATLLLIDGSPFHPDPGHLWRIAEAENLTLFGTSAKYLSALEKSGFRPKEQVELRALKSVLSTGSPLAPASFDFVYRDIKSDLQLSSVAGGTDIISCFGAGNPILPVYRSELQCRALGMKVDVFDDERLGPGRLRRIDGTWRHRHLRSV
jgi:acetoacetyl-CoA synthetase